MEPYGILWDLDGVLADSTRLHYESWRATFEKRGYELSFERFTSTFGRNNHAVLTDMFGRPPTAAEMQTIADEKEIAFRQSVPGQMDLLPGALDWLKQFQAWGFPQAVASSAPPENIEIQMDELNIRPYFAALVSAAGLPGKPDPAVFLKAAAQLGLPPQRCLVMEDAPAGVQGAKTGGMKCMAVLTTNSPASLQGADLIVNRLSDLTPSQVRALLALDAPAEAEDPAFCPIVRRSRPARSH
jgi:HAD superfamily hydrolase (TIGR01509 family)